jgi:glycosyl transferase family 25
MTHLTLPPVVVISLVECRARRAFISEQLEKNKVPFRFFDAERFHEYPENYDSLTRLDMHGNHMNLSEVGCYNSHYRIWEQLAASGDDMWCVLEDDVELLAGFNSSLSAAMQCSVAYGLMRLCSIGGKGSWIVGTLSDGSTVKDHRKQPTGTQGYLIRRSAALVLLEYAKRIVYPVDDLLNRSWEHRIPMVSLAPDVLVHRCDLLGSTTGRTQAQRTVLQHLKREFYNGRDSLSRYSYAWRKRLSERQGWNLLRRATYLRAS